MPRTDMGRPHDAGPCGAPVGGVARKFLGSSKVWHLLAPRAHHRLAFQACSSAPGCLSFGPPCPCSAQDVRPCSDMITSDWDNVMPMAPLREPNPSLALHPCLVEVLFPKPEKAGDATLLQPRGAGSPGPGNSECHQKSRATTAPVEAAQHRCAC